MENNAGLCYPLCQTGYTGVGPVCWVNCPSGWTDEGLFCGKSADWCNFWAWDQAVCGAGWYNTIYSCCSQSCPAGTTDIGVSCAKNSPVSYGRGVGTPLICAPGQHMYLLLCYTSATFLQNTAVSTAVATTTPATTTTTTTTTVVLYRCPTYTTQVGCNNNPHCIWKGVSNRQTGVVAGKCLFDLRKVVHRQPHKGHLTRNLAAAWLLKHPAKTYWQPLQTKQ